jgi:transformation/transcription domain-associated protein
MCCVQFTASLALEGVAEIVLHLSRLNPDMMYVHQDAGFVNVAYFKFDIDELTGKNISGQNASFL